MKKDYPEKFRLLKRYDKGSDMGLILQTISSYRYKGWLFLRSIETFDPTINCLSSCASSFINLCSWKLVDSVKKL